MFGTQREDAEVLGLLPNDYSSKSTRVSRTPTLSLIRLIYPCLFHGLEQMENVKVEH